MLARTVRQWTRRILDAVSLKTRRNVMRARPSAFRPQLQVLEDRALPSGTTIGNVFYIDMENHNLTQPSSITSPQQLLGNPAAPYLNSLITPGSANAAQTSYASNYLNVGVGIHPSEPNYVWQEGGSNFGVVGNDLDPYAPNGLPSGNNVNLIATTGNNPANLSALLQVAYGTAGWHSYQEDMQYTGLSVPTTSVSGIIPGSGTNPFNGSDQYNFAVKHDGTLFYTATNGGTLTGPGPSGSTNPEASYYSPLGQLSTDLANNTVAKYNLITPDQFNDMHSSLTGGFTYGGIHYTGDQSSVAQGDNFLSIIIPQIKASQAYKNNGAIVIWFDETEGGDTSGETLAEIVISPLAKGNAYDSTLTYTHSSDLKSLQELFGVSAPGGGFLGGANTPGTNDLSDMFVPGVLTPSTLGGTVFKNSGNDGQVVAGLTIVLTGINDAHQLVYLTTTTGADGSYAFTGLLPGTYSVSAPSAKKDPGISDITLGVGETLSDEFFSLLGPNSKQ
jgi:phosphatidylinositol-3-phosphatase